MNRFALLCFAFPLLYCAAAHAEKKDCSDILEGKDASKTENSDEDAKRAAEESAKKNLEQHLEAITPRNKMHIAKYGRGRSKNDEKKKPESEKKSEQGKRREKPQDADVNKSNAVSHHPRPENRAQKSPYDSAPRSYQYSWKLDMEKVQKALNPTEQTELARHTADFVAGHWLAKHIKTHRSVAILYGNQFTPLSPKDIEALARLIQYHVKEKTLIVYDADSQAAPVIAKHAGYFGIGVSGRDFDNPHGRPVQILSVTNPYLRMKLFALANSIMISSNSIVGLGLALEAADKIRPPFERYPSKKESPAGKLADRSFISKSSLFGSSWGNDKWRGEPLQISWDALESDPVFSKLTSFDLAEILDSARSLTEARHRMSFDRERGLPIPGGGVVFGASSEIKPYTSLVYDTSRHLARQGVPIVTGGAGGFMKVANSAAYDAGAYSIGIPMIGRYSLKSEQETPDSVQTMTVGSLGYETRIPLLLDRRVLIGVAPGRAGTVREIAASFVHLAAMAQISPQIYFLSSAFYGDFVKSIHEGDYPEELKRSIWLVDSPADLDPILDKVRNDPAIPKMNLQTETAPVPRNDNTSFSVTGIGGGGR